MSPSLSVLPPLLDVSSPSGTPYRPPPTPPPPLFIICIFTLCLNLPSLPLLPPPQSTSLFIPPPLSLSLPLLLSSVLLAAIFSNNVCRAYKTFMMGHKTRLSGRLSKSGRRPERDRSGRWDERAQESAGGGAGSGERTAVARQPLEGLEGHVWELQHTALDRAAVMSMTLLLTLRIIALWAWFYWRLNRGRLVAPNTAHHHHHSPALSAPSQRLVLDAHQLQ